MRSGGATRREPPALAEARERNASFGDLRFRKLLTESEWASLPSAIRRRFSERPANGETIVYVGTVLDTHMSRLGWLLAQAARLIGGPFPLSRDTNVPSVVSVTEDLAGGGQIWTRLYARHRGFPQVIHSAKRFAGPTGLEEHVGRGVGMTLTVHAERGALTFRSARYFLQLGRLRFVLPAWASPGALCVTHAELPGGHFIFKLELVHPRFGALIRQSAVFWETQP